MAGKDKKKHIIPEKIRHYWDECCYVSYYNRLSTGPKYNRLSLQNYPIGVALSDVKLVICSRVICKIKGHDWESLDHGGPESGGIGCQCKRCGESHYQRLY